MTDMICSMTRVAMGAPAIRQAVKTVFDKVRRRRRRARACAALC